MLDEVFLLVNISYIAHLSYKRTLRTYSVSKTAFREYLNKKYKIKISFVSSERKKARSKKTGIDFEIFI